MKIVHKPVENTIKLGSIPIGECFLFENSVYIRTSGSVNNSIQVVKLDDGTLRTMVYTKLVTPVKSEVNFS